MFLYKSIRLLWPEENKKTDGLRADVRQIKADLDYIAMMADVTLEESEDDKV